MNHVRQDANLPLQDSLHQHSPSPAPLHFSAFFLQKSEGRVFTFFLLFSEGLEVNLREPTSARQVPGLEAHVLQDGKGRQAPPQTPTLPAEHPTSCECCDTPLGGNTERGIERGAPRGRVRKQHPHLNEH